MNKVSALYLLQVATFAVPVLAQSWSSPGDPYDPVAFSEYSGSAGRTSWGSAPSIAVTGSGSLVVAWASTTTTGLITGIHVSEWNGSSWSGYGPSATLDGIADWPDTVSSSPSLALDPEGRPVVAWVEVLPNSAGKVIFLRRWTGSDWEDLGGSASDYGISGIPGDPDSTPNAANPSLALDPAGRPMVAWENGQRVHFRHWTGTEWANLAGSASDGAIGGAGAQRSPVLKVDAAGRPALAWESGMKAKAAVFFQRWTGSGWEQLDGSATGRGVGMAAGAAWSPDLALDEEGVPVIAWKMDLGNGSSEIHLRRWSGTRWEELGASATDGGISRSAEPSSMPSLQLDGLGFPVVAWCEALPAGAVIRLGRWTGSAWTDPAASPVLAAVSIAAPSLALDPAGNPCAIWELPGFSPTDPRRGLASTRFENPAPVIGSLSQCHLDGSTPIPPGGFNGGETGFVAAAFLDDAGGSSFRLAIDLHAVETGTRIGPFLAEMKGPGGSTCVFRIDGLAWGTGYRWRARAVDEYGAMSAWVPFGADPDEPSETDLFVRTNAGPDATAVGQSHRDGRPLQIGGTLFDSDDFLALAALFESDGDAVRIEVEARLVGLPFRNEATAQGELVAAGPAALPVPVEPGRYHWQVRAVEAFGLASPWRSFGDNPESEADFVVVPEGSTNAGCSSSTGGTGLLLGPVLLLAIAARRRAAISR